MANVVIIGAGNMGQYTGAALLRAHGSENINLTFYDINPPFGDIRKKLRGEKFNIRNLYQIDTGIMGDLSDLSNADYVIFCVPTDKVAYSMQAMLPYCKKKAIISGQTSRKEPEAKSFDKFFSDNPECGLEYITIHTMCNPRVSNPERENLAIIRHQGQIYHTPDDIFKKAYGFFSGLSPQHVVIFDSVDAHDNTTANTQVLTSITFLSIASTYADQNRFPWLEGDYGNPIDTMKFALAMRAASQEPHVYRGMQYGSNQGNAIVAKAMHNEGLLFGFRESGQKEQFREMMMWAKEMVFGFERTKPILTDYSLGKFSNSQQEIINSNYSVLAWVAALAANDIDPFEDLRAKTPLYTALLCMADRIFIQEGELEKSIDAFFGDLSYDRDIIAGLMKEDTRYHEQIKAWSQGMLMGDTGMYNRIHAQMRSKIPDEVWSQVEKSKEVIEICDTSLENMLRRNNGLPLAD